jgi:hypothetical protein
VSGQDVNNWQVVNGENLSTAKYGYRTPDNYITNKNSRIAKKDGS